ncbi:MAG: peptidylprolyl isomerase [Thermomicrobiales bacterium]|nr:peptidylprolyl isomerase [Thermomicrobiales bacterium]
MTVTIRIETEFGAIRAELNATEAPITVTNFLHYVDEGMYDHGRFHRTVTADNNDNANLGRSDDSQHSRALPNDSIKIQVIQGSISSEREGDLDGPIPLERTSETGLKHLDGTLSMARSTPDSAVSDFFICINDQPDLDFGGMRNPDGQGFGAFGQVTEGMDVVRTIQMQPAKGQVLDPAIPILRIVRES